MEPVLADLLKLLELERIEENYFRGESRDIGSRRAVSYTHLTLPTIYSV